MVIAEEASMREAKLKMDSADGCQDILVTENDKADEAVAGWVSNVRLAKYMEVSRLVL